MKQRDAFIDNQRESRVPLRRRRHYPPTTNAKSQRRTLSRTFGRLTLPFLIIFGFFGWIQWFLAITYLSNDPVSGGARIMSSRSYFAPQRRRKEERQTVHQIQLSDSNIHHSVSHVTPKRSDFAQDWLGNFVDGNNEPHDSCQARLEWQQPQNTPYSCNLLHEFSLDGHFNIVGNGNDRFAVQIQDMQGQDVCLKMMRNIQHYNDDDYHAGWMDLVVTERLSSSPLVITPLASCGLSLVTELATNATLMDHIILARRQQDESYYLDTPEVRLKIAHQVAFALGTLHDMNDSTERIPLVAHNDVCARQFLYTHDGIYKLFDFDSASFTTFDTNGRVCLERPEHMSDEWDKLKAPEEFHRHARKDAILKYKADVWMLGDLLYYILTKQWVFEGISRNEAKLQMLAGIASDIQRNESHHPLDQTIVTAIEMAWTFHAELRPSAREIASFLHGKLEQVFGKPNAGDGTVWRVSIPPLPSDYISTFDDFYENLN